ncbi:unnamed protein product [Rotaria sordida]|uniref:Uncharacterized protein n=1 Tax=Rotaria sordida TaxID=392033 RepID=A0A814YNU4_9BILA|nr:unnamed protein product [Rotaria sordida]
MFRAAHFDLHIHAPTNYSTYVEYNYKERKWTDYALVQPIGRIPPSVIQQYGIPHYYAHYVEWILASQVYHPMTITNNGSHLSKLLNSQSFNKAAISHLQLAYPMDINVAEHSSPAFVHIFLPDPLENLNSEKTLNEQ